MHKTHTISAQATVERKIPLFFNFKKNVQGILSKDAEEDVGAVPNITLGLDRLVSRIRVNVRIGIIMERKE